MKTIETHYKGYRFRSRLEARWAVFFDELHVRYTYEYEGWQLPSGYYLPDFYLPDSDLWIEVKPFRASDKAVERCCELSEDKPVLPVCGEPWPKAYSATYFYPPDHRLTGEDREVDFVFAVSRCDSLAILNAHGTAQIFCRSSECKCMDRYPREDDARLGRAYDKARGARF
jgi:hypothetical protein